MAFVQSKLALLKMLSQWKAYLGTTISVHLYKTAVIPTLDSIAADFTEADYTGYAAVAMGGYLLQYWQSQGAAVAWPTTPALFQPTGSAITNTIYGYWMEFTGSPGLFLGAELLPTPIPMASVADQIIVGPPLDCADGAIPGQVY